MMQEVRDTEPVESDVGSGFHPAAGFLAAFFVPSRNAGPKPGGRMKS